MIRGIEPNLFLCRCTPCSAYFISLAVAAFGIFLSVVIYLDARQRFLQTANFLNGTCQTVRVTNTVGRCAIQKCGFQSPPGKGQARLMLPLGLPGSDFEFSRLMFAR